MGSKPHLQALQIHGGGRKGQEREITQLVFVLVFCTLFSSCVFKSRFIFLRELYLYLCDLEVYQSVFF